MCPASGNKLKYQNLLPLPANHSTRISCLGFLRLRPLTTARPPVRSTRPFQDLSRRITSPITERPASEASWRGISGRCRDVTYYHLCHVFNTHTYIQRERDRETEREHVTSCSSVCWIKMLIQGTMIPRDDALLSYYCCNLIDIENTQLYTVIVMLRLYLIHVARIY